MAKTISGDVKIFKSIGDYQIYTTSGDVKTDGVDLAKNITVKTVSGDVKIDGKNAKNNHILFHTVSGDLEFDDAKDHEGKTFKKVMGNGSISLSISTVSGDFELKL